MYGMTSIDVRPSSYRQEWDSSAKAACRVVGVCGHGIIHALPDHSCSHTRRSAPWGPRPASGCFTWRRSRTGTGIMSASGKTVNGAGRNRVSCWERRPREAGVKGGAVSSPSITSIAAFTRSWMPCRSVFRLPVPCTHQESLGASADSVRPAIVWHFSSLKP